MLISISPNEDSWRSGNISPNEALYFFDCLINMNPSVPNFPCHPSIVCLLCSVRISSMIVLFLFRRD